MIKKDQELAPCFQCGSAATELDWGNVTEYYGVGSQSADISCSQEKKTYCPVQVSVDIDSDRPHDGHRVEQILRNAWNELNAAKAIK